MKMNKHAKIINRLFIMSITGLLLVGCFESKESAAPPTQIPGVIVEKVTKRDIAVQSDLPGRTIASVVAEVRPQVGGIILEQNFTEGSLVKKDDTLYQIDPAVYQANLKQAEATLKRAKANLYSAKAKAGRLNALKASGSKAVSAQDVDDANSLLMQAEAEVFGAEAQVKNSEISLNYTKMLAPISGRIGKSNFTQGALVAPGQALEMAVIQQIDPMRVDITYSSIEYSEMRKKIENGVYVSKKRTDENGNEVEYHAVKVYFEDGTQYPHEGHVRFSDLTVNPTTGSIFIQAEFDNKKEQLLPGMFLNTVIEQGTENGAIAITQKALIQDISGGSKVIVARKATDEERAALKKNLGMDSEYVAEARSVVISRAHGTDWVLKEGQLHDGELLVTQGYQIVYMGLQRSPAPFIPVKIISIVGESDATTMITESDSERS